MGEVWKEIEVKYLNVCGYKEVDTRCRKWGKDIKKFSCGFGNLMHTRIF